MAATNEHVAGLVGVLKRTRSQALSLGWRSVGRDAIDSVYLRVMRRPDLPPFSLRCHVGPIEEYERLPAEYVSYFKFLGGLNNGDSVLDIGCGTGRFAQELAGKPNFSNGSYRGFDVDRRAIEWARDHVRGVAPDVEFDLLDLENSHYNPGGRFRADKARFPYPDASFDFAFAVSVFTHLRASTSQRYLAEVGRVLRPGGRAVLSFVLLERFPEVLDALQMKRLYQGVLVQNGLNQAGRPGQVYQLDGFATLTPANPEIVTIYEESAVRAMIERAGLYCENVHRGSWAQADGGPAFQDLVVVSRPPEE